MGREMKVELLSSTMYNPSIIKEGEWIPGDSAAKMTVWNQTKHGSDLLLL